MFRGLLSSSKRLPEAVLSELVNILFTSLVPIIVIGVTMAAIGTLIALKNGDRIVWALVVAGVLTTVVRGLLIPAYRRQKEAPQTAEPARVWERRYAIGSYTLAALLGLLSARALTTGDPLVAHAHHRNDFRLWIGSCRAHIGPSNHLRWQSCARRCANRHWAGYV
jgi:hypothetical protein